MSSHPPMIVLVTGGRAYRDAAAVADVLGSLGRIDLLAHGGATGADRLAAIWAAANGVRAVPFPAQWRDRDGTYDPAAGFKRNGEMLAAVRPTLVVVLPGGAGTADMRKRAHVAGVEVREVRPLGAFDDVLG